MPMSSHPAPSVLADTKLQTVKSPLTTTGEQLTSLQDITHYNNYLRVRRAEEISPPKNAGALPTRPWTVKVEGKVKQPKTFDIEALLKLRPLEDRVYRHRCVEAWSMVIPWVGYSLSEFIKECDPLPSAKYVQFLSYYDTHVEKWASEASIYSALLRRPAHGRGHESAHAAHLRALRRGAAQPGRRADPHRCAVEVRIQIGEVDRDRALRRQEAADHLERAGAEANTASTPT